MVRYTNGCTVIMRRPRVSQGNPTVNKWRKAAEQGENRAQFGLGELYANGEWYGEDGVPVCSVVGLKIKRSLPPGRASFSYPILTAPDELFCAIAT